MRVFFLLLFALAASLVEAGPQQKDQKPKGYNKSFVVEARGEPRPALKYRLLPTQSEIHEGNAALAYAQCFASDRESLLKYSPATAQKRQELLTKPLADLPKGLDQFGKDVLPIADWAARFSYVNWQIPGYPSNDGLPLPVQQDLPRLLALAKALGVRCRGQIASGKLDEAIESIKTMLAMSRHVGEQPDLMACLVGAAINIMAVDRMEEMIQQSGCPNLFWAMSNLPAPFWDFRRAMDGELGLSRRHLTLLREVTRPWSDKEKELAFQKIQWLTEPSADKEGKPLHTKIEELAADPKHLSDAKKRLLELGANSKNLEQLPAIQIVVADEYYRYERRRDDLFKFMALPYWQGEPGYRGYVKRMASASKEYSSLFWDPPHGATLLRFYLDGAKNHQKTAMLHMVEAIRMYAADHAGQVPPNLEAIQLPLPVDPKTGKSFKYEVRDQKAYLQAASSFDEVNGPSSFKYEITIKR
jgi:hypothetical protein